MAKIDIKYHKLLNTILQEGFTYADPNRKGIKRIQIPSYQLKHDFEDGFPALTTKKIYWKGIVGELLLFLRGDTNIKYLVDNNINIWNKDAYNYYLKKMKNNNIEHLIKPLDEFIKLVKKDGHNGYNYVLDLGLGKLGRVYGAQWRNWFGVNNKYKNVSIDQISNLIKGLKENPMGTRHIVTAWNPAELDSMALPPCHWSFEILVESINSLEYYYNSFPPMNVYQDSYYLEKGNGNYKLGFVREHGYESKISEYNQEYQFTLKWHQRSVDTFLGLPFNIASYALLAQIIGKMTNMIPKGIIGDLSNVHIYEPHIQSVKEQLSRNVNKYSKCKLDDFNGFKMDMRGDIDQWLSSKSIEDFNLINYESYPIIKEKMLPYNN